MAACWIFAVFTEYVDIYQKALMVLCAEGIAGIQTLFNPMNKIIFFPPFIVCHCHIFKRCESLLSPSTKFAK